jgi:hypothetical protein
MPRLTKRKLARTSRDHVAALVSLHLIPAENILNALQHDIEAPKQVLVALPVDMQSADDIALYCPAEAFIGSGFRRS